MEQIYRRRGGERQSRGKAVGQRKGYKKLLLGQAVFCLLVFLCGLFVKFYPDKGFDKVRHGTERILNEDTDFKASLDEVGQFFKKLFREEPEENDKHELLYHLVMPVTGTVTSSFGTREDPVDGSESFHYGVDLGAEAGEKIRCAASGTAAEVGEHEAYGNYILVCHNEQIYTFYAHCESVLPKAGEEIQAGQMIGTVGNTGKSTGPHLHFEIRDGDTWLDPADFLKLKADAS